MLTEEQKKIAEENHALIYYFIRKFNVDSEEYYDLFAIDYLKCIKVWDKEKAKLITLVGKALLNRVLMEKRKKKYQVVSLNKVISEDGYSVITLENVLQCKANVEKTVEEREALGFLTQCEVVKMKMLGYTQQEIANKFNISQSYVSKIILKKKKELQKKNSSKRTILERK